MSGITFSYAYIEQLLAQQQAQAQTAGNAGSGSLTFPYFDPTSGNTDSAIDTQWTTGTSFNLDIPLNSDGSINVDAMLQKLHDILYYSSQGDTMDYNSIMDATGYLMNIGAVWGDMSSSQQQQVTQFLNLPITDQNGNSQTIIDLITQIGIPAAIQGTYYQSNGNQAATLAFAQNLINELNTIVTGSNGNGGCSQLSPLLQEAETLNSTLQNWMNQNPSTPNSFNQFAFGMALEWQTAFSCNTGTTNYFNSWRHTELDDLMAGCHGDPFLEYIMIMYVLMNENGDSNTTIAGQGNLTNYLSDPMGHNAQELATALSSGTYTAASAQAFYSEVMALSTLAQNQSVNTIAPQIAQLFQALTNAGGATQINVTFTNAEGATVTTTLAALFQATQGSSPAPDAWQNLALAMTSLTPSATNQTPSGGNNNVPSFPTQPGYTTLSNLVQQVSNSITSKSTAVGQILQNDEGVNEKDLSMIQAAAEEVINPEKSINQNMAQAGS